MLRRLSVHFALVAISLSTYSSSLLVGLVCIPPYWTRPVSFSLRIPMAHKRHIRLHYVQAGSDARWYAQVRASRFDRDLIYVTSFYLEDFSVMIALQLAPIRWTKKSKLTP